MQPSRADTVRAIEALGVVAVVRLDDPSSLRPVIDALVEGGVGAVEITVTTPRALDVLASLREGLGSQVLLGAGTVLDSETARLAVLAGARFIVGPTLCPGVLVLCRRYEVVAVPGAYTPTEILAAREAGADLIKVFPADTLGPKYVQELRGPLPSLRLVPTGGVTPDNAGAFLAAGAAAVGVGGSLVDRDAVERRNYRLLTERARRLARAVREAREGAH